MPKTKTWTPDDRERALDWLNRKAKTGTLLKDQSGDIRAWLDDVNCIQDPERLANYLAQCLTPDAWKRLLNALRVRKHNAEKEDQPTECPNCITLQNRIAHLELSLKTAQSEVARLKRKPKPKPTREKEPIVEDDDSLQRTMELLALIEAEVA